MSVALCSRLESGTGPRSNRLEDGADWRDGMAALIRHQLENLLRVIELESGGVPLAVETVALRRQNGRRPDIGPVREPSLGEASVRYDSPSVYRHIEPRFLLISHFLKSLGRACGLESAGQDRSIDGYRLKELSFWARYSSIRLFDNFGELSTWCSCDCDFCFLRGSEMLSPKRPMLSVAEARTRARYYSARRQKGLPTHSAPPGEPFANPKAMELLRLARAAQPEAVLDITTNGDYLTEKLISELAEIKPVHIALSLNSANQEERGRRMASRRPEVGIRAVSLLQQYGIQFTGSIVPSAKSPIEDVAESMSYLDRHAALQIRLLLPGYTKYAGPAAEFDTDAFWRALIETAARMRSELNSPLLIQPGYYWNRDIRAFIDGIFPNSPAARAGLRFGDRITRVNGNPVVTRAEAGHFLDRPAESGKPWNAAVEIERQGRSLSVELSNEIATEDDRYPYKPGGYAPTYEALARWRFGVQLMDSFDLGALAALKMIVNRHPQAHQVLLFTTPLVRDIFAQAMQIAGDSPECRLPDVELRVTMARHDFWGGNIVVGDLHVVEDYVAHLNLLARLGYRPDLVIIPSSFTNSWRLDLLGHSYTEIERRTGTTVELLPVRRVMV